MAYIVQQSFVDADGNDYYQGQQIETLPAGADWVAAGFVIDAGSVGGGGGSSADMQQMQADIAALQQQVDALTSPPEPDTPLDGLTWTDLRGTSLALGSDITHRSTITVTKHADGLGFSGQTNWGAWCKVDALAWNPDSDKKSLGMIWKGADRNFMLGVGSAGMNLNSNSMHVQAKCVPYMVGSTTQYVWGWYGCQDRYGWVTRGYMADLGAIYLPNGAAAYKVVITDNGDYKAFINVYALSDENGFDDTSQLVISRQILTAIPFSSGSLMPLILPYQQNAGLRLIAAGVS